MPKEVDLSICIVNTNNKELLRNCLYSIYASKAKIPCEIFVVDNNSSDNSVEMVETAFPEVKLIVNKERLGYATSLNKALNQVAGRYILISNEDIVFKEDTLTKMFNFMEADTGIGVLNCKLLYPDGRLQASTGAYPSVIDALIRLGRSLPHLSRLKLFTKYSQENWNYGKSQELMGCYPMGCCLMIQRQAIEKVGLMDERFTPVYLEETDWCYRIKKAGFKIYYLADAEVVHYHGYTIRRSNKEFKTTISLAWFKNRRYYFRKHHSIASYYFLVSVDFLFFSLSLLYWSTFFLLKREGREIKREHIEYSKKALLEIFHRTKQTTGS